MNGEVDDERRGSRITGWMHNALVRTDLRKARLHLERVRQTRPFQRMSSTRSRVHDTQWQIPKQNGHAFVQAVDKGMRRCKGSREKYTICVPTVVAVVDGSIGCGGGSFNDRTRWGRLA
jgi:hypothetical protein